MKALDVRVGVVMAHGIYTHDDAQGYELRDHRLGVAGDRRLKDGEP